MEPEPELDFSKSRKTVTIEAIAGIAMLLIFGLIVYNASYILKNYFNGEEFMEGYKAGITQTSADMLLVLKRSQRYGAYMNITNGQLNFTMNHVTGTMEFAPTRLFIK